MEFAKRLNQISTSKTLALTNRVFELKQAGIDVISLNVGEPDFETPQHIKNAAIEAIKKGYTRYTQSTGIPQLKNAILNKYKKNYDVSFSSSNVIVTCGGKFALACAILALCNEGDEVLIPSPYYVSYADMVKLAGAKPVFVKTNAEDNFSLDFAALDKAFSSKSKMLIFNNPNNPTGIVYGEKVTKKLAGWLKSTNIIALTDDIYDSIVFNDIKIRQLISYTEIEDQVISVNGVSKTYAMTGWRIGFAVAHKKYISQMAKIQSHMITHPTTISQWAAVEALSGDQSCVMSMKESFKERRDFVFNRLCGLKKVNCSKSSGAFYLFPEISEFFGKSIGNYKIENAVDFCQYLLEEHKVALVPGDAFGAPYHVRISFATSLENLDKAMDRIQHGLQNLN